MRLSDQYDFPSRSGAIPMDNQRDRFDFWLSHRHGFDLSEVGTGKTKTVLWAVRYLMQEAGGSALVIAPLTTLQSVWEKECADILSNDISFYVLFAGNDSRANKVRNNQRSVFIVNPDALLNVDFCNAIMESDIHTLIIDEVTMFKHSNRIRAKNLRKVRKGRNIWSMTATPRPQSPLNAHGIARATLPTYTESYSSFRDRTHDRVTMWKWEPKKSSNEAVELLLQPSIRIKRDDCFALPPCTTERRMVELSRSARSSFMELRKSMQSEIGGARISAPHEAALRNKLLQVCGGAVYSTESSDAFGRPIRKTAILDPGGRATELLELHDQTDEKLVVLVPYRAQLELVEKLLIKEGHSVAVMHGDTPVRKRGEIIEAFQRLDYPRTIVADPRCMAHGVELFRGSIMVWWLPVDSAEVYQQAQGRLTRRGQTRHVRNIQLCGSRLEAEIYDRLEANQQVQGALLEALSARGI
jgi:superfamily II DNA or RNA helicase